MLRRLRSMSDGIGNEWLSSFSEDMGHTAARAAQAITHFPTSTGRLSRSTRRIMATSESALIDEMADAIQPGLKSKTLAVIEGPWGLLAMISCALFALYGTDLWEACGPPPKHMDHVIYSVSMMVFLVFSVELVVLSWCKKAYIFSFFFWLDVLALLSLIPDIFMLFNIDVFLLIGGSEGGLTIARTARAARAAARSARIIRSMKLLSLVHKVSQS